MIISYHNLNKNIVKKNSVQMSECSVDDALIVYNKEMFCRKVSAWQLKYFIILVKPAAIWKRLNFGNFNDSQKHIAQMKCQYGFPKHKTS